MRQQPMLPSEMHEKREWTRADAEILAAAGHLPNLYFAPGVRLPAGFLTHLADAGLNVAGRVTLTDTPLNADDLAAIGRLPGISSLWLDDCPVGDAEIRAFTASLPLTLNNLHLVGAHITDAALPCIASLPGLRDLHLSRTRITDAGLPPLANLPNLAFLWVDGTAVTDAGILTLGASPKCISFNIKDTAVTDAGVDAYFRAWLMAHRGLNSRPPNEDDSESCRLLLTDFFAAMNEWESDCEERRRQVQLGGQPEPTRGERHASVAAIFARFCTEKWHGKERPMWQIPPTYAHVTFFDEEQRTRSRIQIITKEGQSGQDRYLYVLARTPDGWRIDSRKWMGFGAWAARSL